MKTAVQQKNWSALYIAFALLSPLFEAIFLTFTIGSHNFNIFYLMGSMITFLVSAAVVYFVFGYKDKEPYAFLKYYMITYLIWVIIRMFA